jgi:hypothetical protein
MERHTAIRTKEPLTELYRQWRDNVHTLRNELARIQQLLETIRVQVSLRAMNEHISFMLQQINDSAADLGQLRREMQQGLMQYADQPELNVGEATFRQEMRRKINQAEYRLTLIRLNTASLLYI